MNATTPRPQPPTRRPSKQGSRSSATFHKRIKSGNYEAVLGRGMRRTLQAAAADPSLDLEIGALRVVLVRLLREEPDLTRLAASIARLTTVAIMASRQRDSPGNTIQHTLLRELELYEQELENERAASIAAS